MPSECVDTAGGVVAASIAEQVGAVEQEAFCNIGRAYYEGARGMGQLRVWLVANFELRTYRWVRRNRDLAEQWLVNGAGE